MSEFCRAVLQPGKACKNALTKVSQVADFILAAAIATESPSSPLSEILPTHPWKIPHQEGAAGERMGV